VKKENLVILLTGRGNNTLKDKNIKPIFKNPLLSYPAIAGKKVNGVTSFFASSEDSKILTAAAACGYIPIERPHEYSKPQSQHVDCLLHALKIMREEYDLNPDILVVLLANCATIKTEWIEDCINILKDNPSATSAIPVQRNNDHHPLRAKKINNEGYLKPFIGSDQKHISSNRQDLESNYFVCHNFWALNLKNMSPDLSEGQKPWPFMGSRIIPYIVDCSIDVHHEEDIYLTEVWLKKNGLGEER